MGKRIALSLALITSVTTSFVGITSGNGPETSALNELYALHTQAQGFSALTAVHINQLVNNDAVVETPTIMRQISVTPVVKSQPLDVWVTAYSSSPEETDDTPFITASGSTVRDGVAAANFLPIGSKFRIPTAFGDKVFTVEDRMNPRYNGVQIVDLWMDSKEQAIDFGKKPLKIELL
ncbi:MAG: hypothetical protein WC099_03195 [Candidatus Paceibacterota bacterium]